jgi:trans-aconitate methyltransferase
VTAHLLYRDGRVYRGVLRLLYGDALPARERVVASLVRSGASVVDACCGDAGIARRLTAGSYVGVDASEPFVRDLERRGVRAVRLDVARDELPRGDVVLMLGALYQFLPDADSVVDRLVRAARDHVVVAEPHRNLAEHRWGFVRALARAATGSGDGSSPARFNEETRRALFARHGATEVHRTSRELIAVLPGSGP